MALTDLDGPFGIYGSLGAMRVPPFGAPVNDPNQDAGPSFVYQGWAIMDPRIWYTKDQVQGYTGVVQSLMGAPRIYSVRQIPAAVATNNICAAQNVTSNSALTFASASVGVVRNVPIIPFSGVLNGGAAVLAPVALDFGNRYGACVAGNASIQVVSTLTLRVGDPLVIPGVGNSLGTGSLLTRVASIVDNTHITVDATAVPQATNSAVPIGTGNIWGPSEITPLPLPTAAFPFLAKGPALVLDPRQAVTRAVGITGVSGGSGGNFVVTGWDIYGQLMTQLIAVAADANTVYSLKAFKYIRSVVPLFTDAHNYSVGTSDVFGFNIYTPRWENTAVCWNALTMTASTGFVSPVVTNPATNATGDVRGTIQTSASGGGTGIGATVSNGTLSGLTMTGITLMMATDQEPADQILATPVTPLTIFGQSQA